MIHNKTALTFILSLSICFQMQAQDFALPRPPKDMKSIPQRAGYVVEHYWDNADLDELAKAFLETAPERKSGDSDPELEQAFVNYLSVFPLTESDSLCAVCASRLMYRADSLGEAAVSAILDLAEKYLFNADSPMIQEEYFRGFADAADSCRNVPAAQLSKLPFWYIAMDSNRKGHEIEHFSFETEDGTMLDFNDVEGERLLLLYDPDCKDCNRLIEELSAKELDCVVVAVALNTTRERFRSHAQSLPALWVKGWDCEGMINGGAFMIRHFPDLYLVDDSGVILAKHRVEF